MTLREAIRITQDECDAEVDSIKRAPEMNKAAGSVLSHEYEQIAAAHLVHDITGGSAIWPEENHRKVAQWMIIAFRLGMRVQRKLHAPEKPTSMFDITYEVGTENEG